MGKGKPLTGAHLDNGDYVVAINSKKIKVTGKKLVRQNLLLILRFSGRVKRDYFR